MMMIKIHQLLMVTILVLAIRQMLAVPKYQKLQQNKLEFSTMGLSTSFFVNQVDLLLIETLKEIFKGPLQGKSIVFLLGDVNETKVEYYRIFFLLKNLGTPLTHIKLTGMYGEGEEGKRDILLKTMLNLIAGESTFNAKNHSMIEAKRSLSFGDVLLYIPNRIPAGISLLNQSPSSLFDSLLIISRDTECDPHSLLQTAFALRIRYVVLLCPVFIKQRSEDSQSIAFRVYSWRPFQPHQKIVDLGLWSPSTFLSWNDLFIDRFPSFEGQTLHVASDEGDMPFLLPGTEEEYIGVSKNIMDALGASMNFSYTLTPRAGDGRWGMKDNGVWVGMFRDMLLSGKNLTINSFAITWERGTDFDFSMPYFTTGFGFSVLKPPLLPRWMNLTYTFTMEVWLATAVSLVLASVGFYLLSRGRHNHLQLSPFNSFLTVVQGLLKQALWRIPASWSLRIFLALWWVGTYILIVSYSSNLIAMLTVPLYPPRLHTVEQLAESNYRFCMIDFGTFAPQALATSKDANLFALGSRLELVSRVDQGDHGQTGCIDLVLSGDYAQIEFFPYMQYVYSMSGEVNMIYYPRELIYKSSLAFFFLRGTPWMNKFSWGIQQLMEAHLIEKWKTDILQQLSRNSVKVIESKLKWAFLS